jgi:hypothetical protein
MLKMMIRRLASGAAFFVCGVIALWAMWTMLGAAFDSDWLQVARTLMLWTAAVVSLGGFAATVWVIVLISTREATPADMSTAEWLCTRRGNDNSSDDEERAA